MKGSFLKRVLSLVLSAALCFSIFAFSACSDGSGKTIEELTKTVEDLKVELSQFSKEQIEELKTKSSQLEEQVAALKKALDSSNEEVEKTNSRLDELNKTVKLLSDTVAATDLSNAALKEQVEQLKALIETGESGEQLNALKEKVAALEQSLNLSVSNAEELKQRITELESGAAKMKEDLAKAQTASAELQKTVDELNDRMLQAESRILLLEGKADGDPNKVYGLGDTVSYSSNGLKLFELQITEAWKEETNGGNFNCYVNFIFKNLNMLGSSIFLIFNSYLKDDYAKANQTRIEDAVKAGETYNSAEKGTALKYNLVSKSIYKVFFSITYTSKTNTNAWMPISDPFIPFACFELDFPLKAA